MILIQKKLLFRLKKLSLIELIKDGGLGGQLIIGLLFLFGEVIVIYIYFERDYLPLNLPPRSIPILWAQIKTYVLNHKIDGGHKPFV